METDASFAPEMSLTCYKRCGLQHATKAKAHQKAKLTIIMWATRLWFWVKCSGRISLYVPGQQKCLHFKHSAQAECNGHLWSEGSASPTCCMSLWRTFNWSMRAGHLSHYLRITRHGSNVQLRQIWFVTSLLAKLQREQHLLMTASSNHLINLHNPMISCWLLAAGCITEYGLDLDTSMSWILVKVNDQ